MATAKSWLPIPKGSPFSLANIPFGIISTGASSEPRPAIAVGDYALDLSVFSDNDGFAALADSNAYVKCWNKTTLNEFAALGRQANQKVRAYLQEILSSTTPYPQILKDNKDLRSKALIPLKEVINHLPLQIGDYSDFFAGYYHAMKAIQVYAVKLAANFMHIPVGYNGRSAAVVVSGTPIHRPHGQFVETPGKPPVFGPTKQLDFEVELGCFVGKPSAFGEPIRVDDGEDHIFGLVLLNDWSARDIQAWEMPPLGPVNGKSFGTTISPWVVLADAFEQFRAPSVENKTPLLPYLRQQRKDNVYDIRLEARLTTASGNSQVVTSLSSKHSLWSFPQMMAHQTSNGCPTKSGDLFASGTISGPSRAEYGTFLEINDNGALATSINGKEDRSYLLDGDTVTFTGICGDDEDALVGFGTCTGTVLPAIKW